MRKTLLIASLAILGGLYIPTLLFAEKVPESKDEADHVVTAVVEAVYSRTVPINSQFEPGREQIEYVIELNVQEVHKGETAIKGRRFYVHCFDVIPILDDSDPPQKIGIVGMNGHDKIPKAGQVIKAYTRYAYEQNQGLYPSWYEVVEDAPKEEPKANAEK